MKNVLILGANGQISQWAIKGLATDKGVSQTLLVRNPKKLGDTPSNAKVIIGNVLDKTLLLRAVQGQHIVYANLTGEDLDVQAKSVIAAMKAAGVKRLVFRPLRSASMTRCQASSAIGTTPSSVKISNLSAALRMRSRRLIFSTPSCARPG
ncbi:NAD(P)H-binding protein [Paraburkholderia dipogonis]|uniref:NAD(P)H-binding protein n=1 Tax=Paraburkholderia dipogonis TaxID=1211383 RepID=UPI0035ED82A0